ncbi:MAG: septal ring lytic transglycosylase RlpA family protein [Aquificota bacterium]|nr:septal ring lytic transglycosylase RlpA family protein [Aquificota bacterium]
MYSLLLIAYVFTFGNEVLHLELGVKRKKETLIEIKEFRIYLSELLKEEYVEVAPGIKVRKGCKVEKGIASWYGGRFHGRKTANGEIYDLFKFATVLAILP